MRIEKTFRVCFDEEDRRALRRVRDIFEELADFQADIEEGLHLFCTCESIQEDIDNLLNI